MSSILMALRKSEHHPLENKLFLTRFLEMGVKKSDNGGIYDRRQSSGIYYALMTMAVLIAGGWLVHQYVVVPPREPAGNQPVAYKIEKETRTKIFSISGKGLPKKSEKSELKPRLGSSKPAPAKNNTQKTALLKPPRITKTGPQVPLQYKKPDPSPAKSQAIITVEQPAPLEPIQESKFRIQAITWSSIPAERFAVISEQIVHEGDVIDGVIVSQIGLEEVFLKRGAKTLKLNIKYGK